VWFAEPLIAATAQEVRRLIAQAKTVHGIAPLPFQAANFNLFIGSKRAYSNCVFHGDNSKGENDH
jgi:hypothetical protein